MLKRCDVGRRGAGVAAFGLAALAALAACTSGASSTVRTSSHVSTSGSAALPHMGAEVIEGSTAAVDGSSMTLKASGVFADKGVLSLPIGNPRTFTFKFHRGNLVVLNATGPTAGPMRLNEATCAFTQSLSGTFRVLSGNSTGTYAGATGHGDYTFDFGGIAAKTPDGTCDTSGGAASARELAALIRGPVLLNLNSETP